MTQDVGIVVGTKGDKLYRDIRGQTERAVADGIPSGIRKSSSKIQSLSTNFDPKQFKLPLGRITGDLSDFQNSLDASTARVLAFGASASVLAGVVTGFKEIVRATIEVEKSLQDINVIFNLTSSELSKFSSDLFDVARNTGQAFSTVAEAATEFSRQGLSAEQTLIRVRDALILTRLSGLSAVQSVEALTASINGFRAEALNSTEIINKLANVDAAFAVSAADLANGLARSASVAQDAGANFDEVVAAITAVQQITARGGSVIGNSLKTILTRIQRAGVREELEKIGVAVSDSNGNFRDGFSILRDYAKIYGTLSDAQKAFTSEQLAGAFQINILKALVKDLTSEYSIYDNALKISNGSTDEAIQRNEKLNQTLSAMIQSLKNTATEFGSSFGGEALGGGLKTVISIAEQVLKSLGDLFGESNGKKFGESFVGAFVDTIRSGIGRGIGDFLGGPTLILIGKTLFKLFNFLAKDLTQAVKSINEINVNSRKNLEAQRELISLISNNKQLQQDILAASGDLLKQEELITREVQERTAEYEAQKNIIALTKNIAASGRVSMVGGVLSVNQLPKRRGGGGVPGLASVKDVMSLEERVSGRKATFHTKPFPHVRNKSQPTFASAMRDHGGLKNALRDSAAIQSGNIPNFVTPFSRRGAFPKAVRRKVESKISSIIDSAGSIGAQQALTSFESLSKEFDLSANTRKAVESEIKKIESSVLSRPSGLRSSAEIASSKLGIPFKKPQQGFFNPLTDEPFRGRVNPQQEIEESASTAKASQLKTSVQLVKEKIGPKKPTSQPTVVQKGISRINQKAEIEAEIERSKIREREIQISKRLAEERLKREAGLTSKIKDSVSKYEKFLKSEPLLREDAKGRRLKTPNQIIKRDIEAVDAKIEEIRNAPKLARQERARIRKEKFDNRVGPFGLGQKPGKELGLTQAFATQIIAGTIAEFASRSDQKGGQALGAGITSGVGAGISARFLGFGGKASLGVGLIAGATKGLLNFFDEAPRAQKAIEDLSSSVSRQQETASNASRVAEDLNNAYESGDPVKIKKVSEEYRKLVDSIQNPELKAAFAGFDGDMTKLSKAVSDFSEKSAEDIRKLEVEAAKAGVFGASASAGRLKRILENPLDAIFDIVNKEFTKKEQEFERKRIAEITKGTASEFSKIATAADLKKIESTANKLSAGDRLVGGIGKAGFQLSDIAELRAIGLPDDVAIQIETQLRLGNELLAQKLLDSFIEQVKELKVTEAISDASENIRKLKQKTQSLLSEANEKISKIIESSLEAAFKILDGISGRKAVFDQFFKNKISFASELGLLTQSSAIDLASILEERDLITESLVKFGESQAREISKLIEGSNVISPSKNGIKKGLQPLIAKAAQRASSGQTIGDQLMGEISYEISLDSFLGGYKSLSEGLSKKIDDLVDAGILVGGEAKVLKNEIEKGKIIGSTAEGASAINSALKFESGFGLKDSSSIFEGIKKDQKDFFQRSYEEGKNSELTKGLSEIDKKLQEQIKKTQEAVVQLRVQTSIQKQELRQKSFVELGRKLVFDSGEAFKETIKSFSDVFKNPNAQNLGATRGFISQISSPDNSLAAVLGNFIDSVTRSTNIDQLLGFSGAANPNRRTSFTQRSGELDPSGRTSLLRTVTRRATPEETAGMQAREASEFLRRNQRVIAGARERLLLGTASGGDFLTATRAASATKAQEAARMQQFQMMSQREIVERTRRGTNFETAVGQQAKIDSVRQAYLAIGRDEQSVAQLDKRITEIIGKDFKNLTPDQRKQEIEKLSKGQLESIFSFADPMISAIREGSKDIVDAIAKSKGISATEMDVAGKINIVFDNLNEAMAIPVAQIKQIEENIKVMMQDGFKLLAQNSKETGLEGNPPPPTNFSTPRLIMSGFAPVMLNPK